MDFFKDDVLTSDELEVVFKSMDKDGNGTIEVGELCGMVRVTKGNSLTP